ncbi:unnamed protein product [Bemisia tabaci]|uniref:Uncharacterized protein n=1 Tax=Bemisia tabaci TaxID=7038 RepID=A0A9P0F789_BEMTA|nr:unnamed protein product [Bemisia tabaci]
MAPKKAVPSLQDLSLEIVSASTLSAILDPSPSNEFNGIERLKTLNILLNSHILRCHPRFLSQLCVKGLKSIYSQSIGKKPNEFYKYREQIANHLFSVFSSVQPLMINTDEWSDDIFHNLVQQYDKLLNVKIFQSTQKYPADDSRELLRKRIFSRCSSWSQLQSFTMLYTCTDKIINIIALNCPLLQVLDVKFSSNVSDSCVRCLKKSRFLRKVHLSETHISSAGLAEFLTESDSSQLRDFECLFNGHRYILRNALLRMDQIAQHSSYTQFSKDSVAPFSSILIESFRCFDLDTQSLILLSKYFPSISELFLEYQQGMLDFSIIPQMMGSLSKLNLILPSIGNQPFKNAVLFCGSLITELDVLCGVQSHLNEMMSTVPLLCPNIEILKFKQIAFFDEDSFFPPRIEPPFKPFTKLKSLTWITCSQICYANFILKHAHDIKKIDVEAERAAEILFNDFLLIILETNRLQQLEHLRLMHSHNFTISLGMLEFVVANFERIASITCNLSSDDRRAMESFIKENNYDVKLL